MQNFKLILTNSTSPYFNLATEEFLLKNSSGSFLLFWVNEPSVIIGSYQNALMEVNLEYTTANNIKVVRRLTGGGAVYHDTSNLCYSIICPHSLSENAYAEFTKPIIEFLNSLGVKAEFSGRNDITVNGKKISGNAQVIYKNRILHHGTLLFKTDLTALDNALKLNKLKTQSKGVKSNRARVCNISEFLPSISFSEFLSLITQKFSSVYEVATLTNEQIKQINELAENKYATYEWNIASSPKGSNRLDIKFDFGVLTFTFDLIDGFIRNVEAFGDFFANADISPIISNLNGKKYTRLEIEKALSGIEKVIKGASAKEISQKFFS